MPLDDTIAAISSAPGSSARAIIRVSGPMAHRLSPLIARDDPSARGAPAAGPNQALVVRVHLTDALSLPVLALRFDGPRSATGEDVLEILLPGNPLLVERVLAAILREHGVRPATPGEFSARAFLNGRVTLDQAEGIAATIAAQSDAELSAARELLSGESGRRTRAWAEELATLLALVEAGIDFSDQEDVVPIAPGALARRLDDVRRSIAQRLGAGGEARPHLPRVVLAGAPNAGKSTLFNALLGGARRAVVSPIPGTTRDAIEETLHLAPDIPGADPVTLVDLAGLDGDAAHGATIEALAQARARESLLSADVVLWCDPTGVFRESEIERAVAGKPTIRVRTKADLPRARPMGHAIEVCGLDGYHLPALRRAISDAAWGAATGVTVLPRHRRALAQCQRSIDDALAIIDPGAHALADPAIVSASLRDALDALGELTGRLSPDDIIGRIFATFCVGK